MLRLPALSPSAKRALIPTGVALVCATSFFVLAAELGQHYPLSQWLFFRLLPIWGYTLLFNTACICAGALVLRWLLGNRRLPSLEWLLFSMAIGVVVFTLGFYAAGAFCLFHPATAVLLPLALLAAGFQTVRRVLPRYLADHERSVPRSRLFRLAVLFVSVFGGMALTFVYLGALSPASINFDAAWYHYPTAQDYARIGCIVPFPGENHRAYPHLMSILHTWARSVPGLTPLPTHWMLSLHLEYTIVLWRIVGVAAAMRWMLNGQLVPGLWTVFFLFPSIFIYDQNIGGSADHLLGFFAVPTALACFRFLRAFEWRWGIVLGVVLGGHLLVKYQGLFLLTSVTLACLGRLLFLGGKYWWAERRRSSGPRRKALKRLLLGPAVLLGVGLVVTAPHFAKNVLFYNNPVYPFAQNVFSASYPKYTPPYLEELPVREPFTPKYEGLRRQQWAFNMLFSYSFDTANRKLTARRPYMGALFSLLLPCLIFFRRASKLWCVAALGAGAFLTWANLTPNDRYLLSFYDLFIAFSGAAMVRVWQLGLLPRLALVPLVGLSLVWGADAMLHYGQKRLNWAIDIIAEGYQGKSVRERLDTNRDQQDLTAALPEDAVILSRNVKDLLGLERTVLLDERESQDYFSYSRLTDAGELWKELRARGVTHLLYSDGRRPPTRVNGAALFAELFHNHISEVQRFGRLVVGEFPTVKPEARSPLLVLSLGMDGIQDGLYPVNELDVDYRRADKFRPAPRPLELLSDDNAVRLIQTAHVVVSPNVELDRSAARTFKSTFKKVESFKEKYAIYLKPLR